MAEIIVICPVCRKPTRVRADLYQVLKSIQTIGCDDCVWKLVRQRSERA